MKRAALLAALLVAAAPTPSDGKGAKKMFDEAAWHEAEARVTDDLKRAGHPPTRFERHPHMPGLLRVLYDRGEDYRLVHQGQVVKKKGLKALAAYLRESGFLARAEATSDDFRVLLLVLEAWPPVPGPDGYLNDPARQPTLAPTLTFAPDGHGRPAARFVLHYAAAPAPRRGGGGGGGGFDGEGEDSAPQAHATAWTLTIAHDHQLTWKSEPISYQE